MSEIMAEADHSDATAAAIHTSGHIVSVAIPAPLYARFDYLVPARYANDAILPGCRVRVPFGRRTLIGLVLGRSDHSDVPAQRLKPLGDLIDRSPVLPEDLIALLQWAAAYYQHPPGEVMHHALPALLRQGKPARPRPLLRWKAADGIDAEALAGLHRAPRQQQVLQRLLAHADGCDESELNATLDNWRPAMKALTDKSLAACIETECLETPTATVQPGPALNTEQQQAVDAIAGDLGHHVIHLVHGITGSGKTEIYTTLSTQVLAAGRQVLVLVPEISLTPQLTERFRQRIDAPLAVLHSGLNDQQRFCAWYAAASGHARLVIGTRSAIFTPLPDLGLVIIDEEHDGSYKQQEGFRYNARDLALVRAQKKAVPVVLGSATPSLESLHNVNRGRYRLHRLTRRARASTDTRIEVIDLRSQPMSEGLSAKLLDAIQHHLDRQGQVLMFLNRRGYSPLLMCHACGWTTNCRRCDAHMTYHRNKQQLHCHHCGAEARAPTRCADCGSEELIAIGAGTERIEHFLQERFPGVDINRIDRDTTRRKGALQDKLDQAHAGEPGILVGTQMLAKGHDFPNVTLVGILDTDQALYSADFRAAEHLAQLITQVAGRAGRAEKPGVVLIQSHHPDHPLLQTLLHKGYDPFAAAALAEREQAGLPPSSHLVLLRCAAIKPEQGQFFMQQARTLADELSEELPAGAVDLFGPVPAPMERRAGRYRTQIMLQSRDRAPLHRLLRQWLPRLQNLKTAKQVRWSVDVDPYDTY